jgi:nitrous oxide reductase
MIRDLGETKTNRRKFLRNVAVAGGLAAVAGSTVAVANATTAKAAPEPVQPKGYRVTGHVSKYYEKARF